jgi:hypothetical protein
MTKSSQDVRHVIRFALAWVLMLAGATAGAQAETPVVSAAAPPAAEYLRLGRDDSGVPVSLQTSIVRFRPTGRELPGDLEVDLVGAIHIADSGYYEELNARFREYDAVLYELVAAEGTRVPLGGVQGGGLLGGVQGGMAELLGLGFQLDHVDYTRPNLIHADLSPEDISRSMAARGETPVNLLARLLAMSMSEYSQDPMGVRSLGLIAAMFSVDRERLLKAQLAPMLLEMETATAAFEGQGGTSLIGERNKRAVSVLQERILGGDRRIAIFYGAAHMSGMAELIEADLGLRAGSTEWLDAWDLR